MRMTQAEYLAYNARTGIEQVKPGAPLVPCGPGVEREADLHDEIIAECKRLRIYCVHSRMDRRSTNQVGCPDFIVAAPDGRTLWVEAKRKGGKLTAEQNATIHWLRSLGHRAEVVFSLEEFLKAIA